MAYCLDGLIYMGNNGEERRLQTFATAMVFAVLLNLNIEVAIITGRKAKLRRSLPRWG